MSDYISREAAKCKLKGWITDCEVDGDKDAAIYLRDCIDLLDDLPAADVAPVVRCKDCTYKEFWFKHDLGAAICAASGMRCIDENDFCSAGELREGV